VVIDTLTGRFDNFNGHWGKEEHLSKFVQMYAVERRKSKRGGVVTPSASGSSPTAAFARRPRAVSERYGLAPSPGGHCAASLPRQELSHGAVS
jgi:hypothetical protein